MDPDLGWIDLGVRPVVDSSFERRAKAATDPAMRQAGESAGRAFGDEAGDEATAGLSAKVKDWSKTGAVALGGGLGLAIGVGLRGGLERDRIGDVVAAGLGLDPREQERQGKVAGSLYAHAFGDSYEDVARGVAAVQSSLPGLDGNGEIRRASADALNFAQVFGVEVPRSVQLARTIITSGLAKDAEAAFDLMVRASQKVPENVREDVLDTAEEYGQFFKTLGFDGKQAFDLLVASAGLGVYGVDKAGDAIKEFTILATDGRTRSWLAVTTPRRRRRRSSPGCWT
jgi:phage-related minor tail protein